MCHAAAWIRSGVRDGHGQFWKAWSSKAMAAFPELPIIARCHSYAIRTKYTYVCDKCGQRVGRHSKSLDTAKKVCAYCGGKFKLMMPNGSSERTPNNFASFVQEHYKSLRTPGTSHAYAMKLLSKKFAETKLLH
jgi:DNA-directed RNA polymerase subunit RPC12/RpoP